MPVARASMVGAAMVRMSTDVAAHQDGKATTVTLTLTTACLSLVPIVVPVVTALMSTRADACEAGVERPAKKTLTSVHHHRVCTGGVLTWLRLTAVIVVWGGTEKIVASTSTSVQASHAEI